MAAGQTIKLNWNGAALKRDVLEAARKGMNATLADCVLQAQQPGYAPVDTGALKNSIRMNPAQVSGTRVEGSFGAYVTYAIWQEIGTRSQSGKHYLRRAADLHVPSLQGHIKGFMP